MQPQEQKPVSINDLSLEQLVELKQTFGKKCEIFKDATTLLADLVKPFLAPIVINRPDFTDLVQRFGRNELGPDEIKFFAAVPGVEGQTFYFHEFLMAPELVGPINANINDGNSIIARAVDDIANTKAILTVYDSVVSFINISRAVAEREATIEANKAEHSEPVAEEREMPTVEPIEG